MAPIAATPRQILVATDMSQGAGVAVARAAQLAREHGAYLTALHVLPAGIDAQLADCANADLEAHLADYIGADSIGSTPVHIVIRRGKATYEVAAEAADRAADLVVVGAHGAHWPADAFVGSTADNLVRMSPTAVLLVKNPATTAYRTAVLALDDSAPAAHAARFATALTPSAEHILVHICSVVGEALMRMHGAADEQIEMLRRSCTDENREYLTRLAATLSPAPTRVSIEAGHPATRLVELCQSYGADLAVVGTGARTPVSYAFLGSVAQHHAAITVRRARCTGREGLSVGLHPFATVAVILAIATVAGLVATRLRQPLIVAFIGVGVAVGPVGTGWVSADSTIDLLAKLGIAILLFLVGLRLDFHMIRSTGPVAVATGLGQVVFTSVIGYLIAIALGMDSVTALYVAVALTFSSTIIIVKLLSDKRELDQLHGRIAVGFLIVQDIVVVLVMIALTAFGQDTGDNLGTGIAAVLGKGAGLLGGMWLLMRYILPWLLPHIAKSQELLVLFGVAYATSVAALSEWLGFSSEVGAFLAGVSLASTPFRDALGARLVSLRDFLLLFFFLDLGAQLEFTDTANQLTEALILSVFVLIGNPLIVIAIMSAMRYPVRVGFLAGLTVAQISEFSLILAALGLSLGHITNATVSLITVVGLITIGGSTYLIMYSHPIYDRLKRWLSVFERHDSREPPVSAADDVDVILFGLGRFGSRLADRLSRSGQRVLAVDFDPHQVKANTRGGVTAMFGSAEDIHLLEALPLSRAKYVVSAIPSLETNLALLHNLRHHQFDGTIALTAHTRHDAEQLRAAGLETVLEPFSAAAHATSIALEGVLTDTEYAADGADGMDRDPRD